MRRTRIPRARMRARIETPCSLLRSSVIFLVLPCGNVTDFSRSHSSCWCWSGWSVRSDGGRGRLYNTMPHRFLSLSHQEFGLPSMYLICITTTCFVPVYLFWSWRRVRVNGMKCVARFGGFLCSATSPPSSNIRKSVQACKRKGDIEREA